MRGSSMPSHEAVLRHLRMAGERRIPWRRRPPLFAWLLGWGMIEMQRLPPEGNTRAPALFEMAVLTGAGHSELERLQRLATEAGWQALARTGYRQDTRTPHVSMQDRMACSRAR